MTARTDAVTRLVAAAAAAALGLVTVRIVGTEPGLALAPPGATGLATLLLPGWALVVVGLVGWARRQEVPTAVLLGAAGFAWFLTEWNTPGVPTSLGFTTGLVLYAALTPIVAHAALRYPTGEAPSAFLVAGYGIAVVGLGLLPALLADPAAQGCRDCGRDLLAATSSPGAALDVTRGSLAVGAVWSLTAAALVVRRAAGSAPALRRARAGVSAATAAFLALTAWTQARSSAAGSLGVDDALRRLHAGQAMALLALAAAAAWGWTRRGRTRARVARLVLDLAATPPPGGLRDSLANHLGDRSLRLGYRLTDGRLVDIAGLPVEVTGASTPLVRGRDPVAVLVHRPGLLDDPRVADEVAAAARLALENERLQAELAAQLAHLTASRQRVVAAADAARRRLERDLHDGAQQQLVGLLLRLRLDRSAWSADVDQETRACAAAVERDLAAAVEELRDLARGIFPSVLAEEGLAPAVEDFAETAAVPVRLGPLPEQRLPPAVESAGYYVVAESVRRSAASAASVDARTDAAGLSVSVQLAEVASPDGWVTAVEDRVGASDGTLTVVPTPGGLRIEAVIPCGS